jgi:hypothetical protein
MRPISTSVITVMTLQTRHCLACHQTMQPGQAETCAIADERLDLPAHHVLQGGFAIKSGYQARSAARASRVAAGSELLPEFKARTLHYTLRASVDH